MSVVVDREGTSSRMIRTDNEHGNTNRREFLFSSAVVLTTTLALNGQPQPANAAYGESASVAVPGLSNYIEFLIEKNTVTDTSSFLYKGPDPKVQLERLLEASKRLQDIPPLAEDKKWSQISGILLGPLGTLGQTLSFIAKEAPPGVQAKAKKVKEDVFSINTAASKKNAAEVVAQTEAASKSLEDFVRAAF